MHTTRTRMHRVCCLRKIGGLSLNTEAALTAHVVVIQAEVLL